MIEASSCEMVEGFDVSFGSESIGFHPWGGGGGAGGGAFTGVGRATLDLETWTGVRCGPATRIDSESETSYISCIACTKAKSGEDTEADGFVVGFSLDSERSGLGLGGEGGLKLLI